MAARSGWVKFRREWLENPAIAGDADRLAVFMYLLCNAAIEPTPAMFGGKPITLQPGQLTAGRRQIADAMGVQEFKVMRTAKRLETAHLIAQQTSNKNSLFSILCGDFSNDSAQQNEQQMHINCTHLKNGKLRNILSSELSQSSSADKQKQKKIFEHEETPFKAARWLADQIEARNAEKEKTPVPIKEADVQRWALAFDRCNRLDGRSWEDINNVLSFSQDSPFWQNVISSGDGFRRNYGKLLAHMPVDYVSGGGES